jgi:hypothetical protein
MRQLTFVIPGFLEWQELHRHRSWILGMFRSVAFATCDLHALLVQEPIPRPAETPAPRALR